MRNLLRFHLALGLDRYPASERLSSFLQGRARGRAAPAAVSPVSPLLRRRRDAEPGPATGTPRVDIGIALRELRRETASCALCALAGKAMERGRETGSGRPILLVVGDWLAGGDGAGGRVFGPGEDEMLAKMMGSIDLGEQDYYVTNVLKCVPPPGRQPPPDAAAACRAWLVREIAILGPRLILAMGELATRILTGSKQPLARSHGRFLRCRCGTDRPVQVLPTYHPRLLLRQEELKRVVWQDLRRLAASLGVGGRNQGRGRTG